MTHDSQIVRAKENLKLSHGWPSYNQASGTNPPIKNSEYDQEIPLSQTADNPMAPRGRATQSFTSEPSLSLRLTHRRANKEGTIAISPET